MPPTLPSAARKPTKYSFRWRAEDFCDKYALVAWLVKAANFSVRHFVPFFAPILVTLAAAHSWAYSTRADEEGWVQGFNGLALWLEKTAHYQFVLPVVALVLGGLRAGIVQLRGGVAKFNQLKKEHKVLCQIWTQRHLTASLQGDPTWMHRLTIWYKEPKSDRLVVFARSCPQTEKSRSMWSTSPEDDFPCGLAGKTYIDGRGLTLPGPGEVLPDLQDSATARGPNQKQIELYAEKTYVSCEDAKERLYPSRSFCTMPIKYPDGSRWGALVFDSVSELPPDPQLEQAVSDFAHQIGCLMRTHQA